MSGQDRPAVQWWSTRHRVVVLEFESVGAAEDWDRAGQPIGLAGARVVPPERRDET